MLTLNPTTFALLVLADFDDAFSNTEIPEDVARGYNRHRVAQFAYFEHVIHLVTLKEDLITDMTWAPFDLVQDTRRKITFRRRRT
jgi:hypothetical protein